MSLLLIPAILATNLIYEALNHGPYRIFLETPLDRALPVVPIFAIPYVSLIPYIGLSLIAFLFFRIRVYRSAALTMIVVWFISYAFYFFLQSYVARPAIMGTDPFSGMIRTIYASDQPYNDFPSLHTSLSTVIAIHWWRFDRRIGHSRGDLDGADRRLDRPRETALPRRRGRRPGARRGDLRIGDARRAGSLMHGFTA